MLLSQQVRKMGEYKLTSLFFCKILKKMEWMVLTAWGKRERKLRKGNQTWIRENWHHQPLYPFSVYRAPRTNGDTPYALHTASPESHDQFLFFFRFGSPLKRLCLVSRVPNRMKKRKVVDVKAFTLNGALFFNSIKGSRCFSSSIESTLLYLKREEIAL